MRVAVWGNGVGNQERTVVAEAQLYLRLAGAAVLRGNRNGIRAGSRSGKARRGAAVLPSVGTAKGGQLGRGPLAGRHKWSDRGLA